MNWSTREVLGWDKGCSLTPAFHQSLLRSLFVSQSLFPLGHQSPWGPLELCLSLLLPLRQTLTSRTSPVFPPVTSTLRKSSVKPGPPLLLIDHTTAPSTCSQGLLPLKAPILTLPDPQRQYVVEVDLSDFTIRAVLSQWSLEDNKLHPCAFLSRKLSPAERNYDVGNRSCWRLRWPLARGSGAPFPGLDRPREFGIHPNGQTTQC